jgi:hypothetical protein
MTTRTLALALLLALVPLSAPRAAERAASPAAGKAGPAARVPDVPYEMFKLANGLTVIVHEDRTNPIVGVHV